MQLYLRFLKEHLFCKKNILPLWGAVITVTLTSVFSFLTPVISKLVIDSIATNPNIRLLNLIGIFSMVIILLASALGIFQNIVINRLTQTIALRIRNRFFTHIQELSWDFFDKFKTGELQFRMFNDVATLAETATMLPINFFLSSIVLLLANFIMFYLSWKVALFVNLVLVINCSLYIFSQKRIERYTWAVQNQSEEVYGLTQEQIERFKLAQLSSATRSERRITFKILRRLAKLIVNKNTFVANSNVAIGLVSSLWSTGILWIGGYLVIQKSVTLGDLTAFMSVTGLLIPVSTGIVSMVMQYPVIKVSIFRFYEILDKEPALQENPAKTPLEISEGNICFKNVSFSFPGTDALVFDGLSLKVRGHSLTVIIGPSGVGKSTFLKLVARLYDPQSGSIEIDSMDLRSCTLRTLRKQIGYVGGYNTIFSGTVLDNISYGIKDFAMDEVIEAAQMACIHDRISMFPDGYYTLIGRKGVELSDGEKQRINLARCFLAKPKLWLLDEATANLDRETERKLMDNLAKLKSDYSIVMISHRLEVLNYADNVIDFSELQLSKGEKKRSNER